MIHKGGHQNGFSEKVGHLAQPADPSPPPRKLGRQKKKKKFNVYFAFLAILSILFVDEKLIFGWDNELGPAWIDKILLPHLCIVCFITFLAIYQGKFGFGKF